MHRRGGRAHWLCATMPHHSFRPCPLFRQTVASGYCCCHCWHSPAEATGQRERERGRTPRLCCLRGCAWRLALASSCTRRLSQFAVARCGHPPTASRTRRAIGRPSLLCPLEIKNHPNRRAEATTDPMLSRIGHVHQSNPSGDEALIPPTHTHVKSNANPWSRRRPSHR